ncbi:uncharacterized protein [Clytia hemisphaerica]|uniref:uncharacterized protein n=1 Tax=Clytia hemisphaerica TaxID=252671 RepID=UPI0034D4DC04
MVSMLVTCFIFVFTVSATNFPLSQFFGLDPTTQLDEQVESAYLCAFQPFRLYKCCSCYENCAQIGSCCIDKFWNNSVQLEPYLKEYFKRVSNLKQKNYECTQLVPNKLLQKLADSRRLEISESFNYSMIASCVGKPVTIKTENFKKCYTPSEESFMELIPVVGQDGHLYRNRACAECNNMLIYTALLVRGDCPSGLMTESPSMKGLNRCKFKIDNPSYESFECKRHTTQPEDCSDPVLRRQCQLYTGPMGLNKDGLTYPSYHCYKCLHPSSSPKNTKKLLKQECSLRMKDMYWSMLIDYSSTVTFKSSHGTLLKRESSCNNTEAVFDVFSNKCYLTSPQTPNSQEINIKTYWYISTICTPISLACYLVTLLTYSYFQELRNLHGYNIIAMCCCLIICDSLFIIADKTSCYIIGVVLHWVLLAYQMWVAIICFDLAYSFHVSINSTYRNKKKTFIKYLCLAFGIPLIFVVPTLVFSLSGVIDAGYIKSCRTFNQTLRLAMYIIPIALLNVISFCVLLKTFRKIYIDKKETNKTLRGNQQDISVVKIALKLILGLGLIECIGFVRTEHLGSPLFDHIIQITYNVVRSLRGVFVFLVFIVNQKVWKLYKRKFSNGSRTGTINKLSSGEMTE